MKKKDVETTKRMNLFALAKSNKEFSDLVSNDELKEIHRQYDQYEQTARAEREDLRQTTAANILLAEQIREVKWMKDKLEDESKSITIQNQNLKQQCLSLKMKESMSQKAVMSLSRVLEERQEEYSSLRNHYKLLENAIKGTDYVNDIQERILKASADVDHDKAVVDDQELVKQIDNIKRQNTMDKSEIKVLRVSNSDLQTDLAKVTRALKLVHENRSAEQKQEIQNKVIAPKNQDIEMENHNQEEMRNLVSQIQKDHSQALEQKLKEIIDLRSQLQSVNTKLSQLEQDQNQNSSALSKQSIDSHSKEKQNLEALISQH